MRELARGQRRRVSVDLDARRGFTRYPSAVEAFREKDGRADADAAVESIRDWLVRIGMRQAGSPESRKP